MADYQLSATIIGADKLKAAFDNFGAIAAKNIAQALNQTAGDIAQDAKNLAPHKTGRLIDSIDTEDAQASQGLNMTAKVGTSKLNIPYARAQEYGTVGMTIHGRSKLGKRFDYIGNIKGKHYMKQARDNGKVKLTENSRAALQRITSSMATK